MPIFAGMLLSLEHFGSHGKNTRDVYTSEHPAALPHTFPDGAYKNNLAHNKNEYYRVYGLQSMIVFTMIWLLILFYIMTLRFNIYRYSLLEVFTGRLAPFSKTPCRCYLAPE